MAIWASGERKFGWVSAFLGMVGGGMTAVQPIAGYTLMAIGLIGIMCVGIHHFWGARKLFPYIITGMCLIGAAGGVTYLYWTSLPAKLSSEERKFYIDMGTFIRFPLKEAKESLVGIFHTHQNILGRANSTREYSALSDIMTAAFDENGLHGDFVELQKLLDGPVRESSLRDIQQGIEKYFRAYVNAQKNIRLFFIAARGDIKANPQVANWLALDKQMRIKFEELKMFPEAQHLKNIGDWPFGSVRSGHFQ